MVIQEPEFTNQADRVLAQMEKMAAADRQPNVGTEYLLLALVSIEPSVARQILAANHVTPPKVRNLIEELTTVRDRSGRAIRRRLYSPRLQFIIEEAAYEAARQHAAAGPGREKIAEVFESDPVQRMKKAAVTVAQWKQDYRTML